MHHPGMSPVQRQAAARTLMRLRWRIQLHRKQRDQPTWAGVGISERYQQHIERLTSELYGMQRLVCILFD